MRDEPGTTLPSDTGNTASPLEQWRDRVSRWSVAVLLIALGTFLMATALQPPASFQALLPGLLAAAVGRWLWLLSQGRCPACAGTVRLQQRLTLPTHCPGCGCKLP